MFVVYRHLVIEDPIAPPSAEEIAAIEKVLDTELSFDFLEFLSVAHGGLIEYDYRSAPTDGGEELSLGRIFRTRREGNSSYRFQTFLETLKEERRDKGLPRQVLPFARGGGDVMHYLDLTPEGAGRIVVFLEGVPAWAGPRQESAFIDVAPSFNAFLGLLTVNETYCMECLKTSLDTDNLSAVRLNVEFLDLALPEWKAKYPDLAHKVVQLTLR